MEPKPYLVAGHWKTGSQTLEVRSPFSGEVLASVGEPTGEDVETAVQSARDFFSRNPRLSAWERSDALTHIAERLNERRDELTTLVAMESGKPIKWAKSELVHAVLTARETAEEARRLGGELMRLDTDSSMGSRLGIVRRFPVGPVLAITPFNFPVALVIHKLAPALAVGAPMVVKPSPKTPLSALMLGELFVETDLPRELCSILPLTSEGTQRLASDSRFAKVSFTGSTDVGWKLRAAIPKASVTLELGGNAGVIVHRDAKLDRAAMRIAWGGFYNSGQSCIAVQRVLVHQDVASEFTERLISEVRRLNVGDPLDPETDVGPMIDRAALDRVSAWVDEATRGGATILEGAKREDPFYYPTLLANTSLDMNVRCKEIFGPVVTVDTYTDVQDAMNEMNSSNYGLQAGVFSSDIDLIFEAHQQLQVGGVIANDVPAFRAYQMPYGGSKDSGVGREGPRYAMEELTESRSLVISHIAL